MTCRQAADVEGLAPALRRRMEEVVLQHQHAPKPLLAPLHPVLDGRGSLKQSLPNMNYSAFVSV
jgi:hypothetical protein